MYLKYLFQIMNLSSLITLIIATSSTIIAVPNYGNDIGLLIERIHSEVTQCELKIIINEKEPLEKGIANVIARHLQSVSV